MDGSVALEVLVPSSGELGQVCAEALGTCLSLVKPCADGAYRWDATSRGLAGENL